MIRLMISKGYLAAWWRLGGTGTNRQPHLKVITLIQREMVVVWTRVDVVEVEGSRKKLEMF